MTGDLAQVVEALGRRPIPVLASTEDALRRLRRDPERVSARDISRIVLRDPLMTLEVLRFAEARRGPRQSADITTVEHAVMMHGIESFMTHFRQLQTLEQTLAEIPQSLRGALHVVSRSQHAAAYARAIAKQRHDIETDEVIIGALLHDLAELMLWFHAPEDALHAQCLINEIPGVRSAQAQRLVFGFTHGELQLALARTWNLPSLLVRLMDDDHADHPRVINVSLAAALARHTTHGWHDAALPDDYALIEKMLNFTPDGAYRLVRNASLSAARQWQDTGVRPVAAWLPMEEGRVLEEFAVLPAPKGTSSPLFRTAMGRVQKAGTDIDAETLVAATLFALHYGMGFERVSFAEPAQGGDALRVRYCIQSHGGRERDFTGYRMSLSGRDLLSRLQGRMQGVWGGGPNHEKLAALLLPEQRELVGPGEFLLMAFHDEDRPLGVLVASRGGGAGAIPEAMYPPFKSACMVLAQKLARRRGHG